MCLSSLSNAPKRYINGKYITIPIGIASHMFGVMKLKRTPKIKDPTIILTMSK